MDTKTEDKKVDAVAVTEPEEVVEDISDDIDEFRYAVMADGKWLPVMVGTTSDEDPSLDYAGIFGKPITKITIGGVEKYRVFSERGKWSKFFTKFDKENPAGNNTPILAVEIHDKNAVIGIHVKGGSWLPAKHATYEGSTDVPTYAGVLAPIDGLWIDK